MIVVTPVLHIVDERERTAAEVLLGCAPAGGGRILIVDDQTGVLETGLQARGWTGHHWRRVSSPLGRASSWPDDDAFDAACIRLSKDKGAFEMALHAVASVLKPDAPVWVYGANDEGIKSAPKRIKTVFADVTVIDTRRHCRVLQGRGHAGRVDLKRSLEAWSTTTSLDFGDVIIDQRSYPGVFAKGRLDAGTRLLLDTLPPFSDTDAILDYAAGSGVIGLRLRHLQPGLHVTLVEADAVALEAAKVNLPEADAVLGHALTVLPENTRFDAIIANPPYHNGKGRSSGVIHRLVEDAPRHLVDGGALWMVLQNQVDVRASLAARFETVEVVASDTRYKVWRAAGSQC